jgi:type I restriction enzyme S subunit
MTEHWHPKTLGALVSFKTGKLDSNAAVANGSYPFFTCSQNTLRTNTFSFDTECVLLAGNNANGIFPLKYFSGKFDAYQRTYIVRPLDRNLLSTKFLYYALRPKLSELRSISTRPLSMSRRCRFRRRLPGCFRTTMSWWTIMSAESEH